MITTLTLYHPSYGTPKKFPILTIEPEGFVIRWAFEEFTLHVKRNKLVKIRGNRIIKTFDWYAKNIEELREFHHRWEKAKQLA